MPERVLRHGVCCPAQVAELSGVRVVGERINPTGKTVPAGRRPDTS